MAWELNPVTAEPSMLPLKDLRIVEFCEGFAGPYCAMILADLGADVIKVEKPEGGDALRHCPPLSQGYSETFAALNRNKRSVVLNLESPEGREAALQLALFADVVIESHAPGGLAKLGLGYDALAAAKPELIYCSISPFGQTGPRALQEGDDVTVQAVSGLMSATGEAEGPPTGFGAPLANLAAALYGTAAIQAALLALRDGASGQYIDVAMLSAALGLMPLHAASYFGTGRDPKRRGSADPWRGPHQAYRAADGWFVLTASDDRHWHSVCQVIGRPELFSDQRFTTAAERAENHLDLQDLLEERLATQPVAHWLAELTGRGVPCTAINSVSQALNDPQVLHLGLLQEIALPSGIATRMIASPFAFGGETPEVRRAPPALGEHTRDVLWALGRTGGRTGGRPGGRTGGRTGADQDQE
jgi:crotonobetainyl-CoA:carnitine CoA-transferase CaiB-like acyl-CoA transferase